MKNKKGETLKKRLSNLKKRGSKRIESTKEGVKKGLNINRYNKNLFILETVLLIGALDEFFESLILKLDFGIYLNVLLVMLSVGVLFTLAFNFIEKYMKGIIIWMVRVSNNKIIRFAVHLIILGVLFYLYAQIFFNVKIGLVFNVGLSAV